MRMFLPFLVVIFAGCLTASNLLNNTIIGDPTVKCGPWNIDVQASTAFPFEGVVYIKDWRRSSGCFSNGSINPTSDPLKPNLFVSLHDLSQCGMEMKRDINTGDVVVKGVWVFSFHPMFITRVDKAFSVNCIFKQREYTVTSKFFVNDLSTVLIGRTASMPSVVMKVVNGRVPDPRLADATVIRVGDPIQILWFLPTQSSVVGIRVKHCTAENRRGNRVQIINDGCTTDSLAVSDVTYSAEKDKANALANAFKFADNEDMWLKCTVSVCMKTPSKPAGQSHPMNEASCDMVQPCNTTARRKRLARFDTSLKELQQLDDEVLEQRISVLDSYNKNKDSSGKRAYNDSRIAFYSSIPKRPSSALQKSNSICVGRNVFALLSSIFILIILSCLTLILIALYVYYQQKS